MIFPDCRTDDTYNQKYLKDRDASFINGFDFGLLIATNFLNDVSDGEGYINECDLTDDNGFNVGLYLEKHANIVEEMKKAMEYHFESERDTAITSMLDCYSDFDERKAKIDNGEMESDYEPLYEDVE